MGLDLQTCIFTFRQIKAAIDDFNPANRIGEDGSGSIYKVQYYSIVLHNHSCDSIYLSLGIEDLQIIKNKLCASSYFREYYRMVLLLH